MTPLRLCINGKDAPANCRVVLVRDHMSMTNIAAVEIPHFEQYLAYLTEINQAPTLDAVVRNWSKHDTSNLYGQVV
jgi:hypothetical protein